MGLAAAASGRRITPPPAHHRPPIPPKIPKVKHVRGDEPEASAVFNVDRGEGDAPVVVDAAEAGSSSGTRAALRRAVTVEGSAQPAVSRRPGDVLAPAQADDQGFNPNDPYYRDSKQYRELYGPRECDEFEEEASDNCSEEDSEDIDNDKEDRDRKSRFDIESLIQHATGVGKGSAHKHKAASKAKHAAFGKFLRDYVKTGLIPLVGPAVGPHVLH
ncbi:hypothetical protein QYE76_063096 [Lolium multiflorum]|uniref:Zinc finger-XS domain-containing protein n=1 Tax=Lolium multiflorum TaxID=4521 RepID=A0AAD8S3X3_LOLMU|nr:hypothetical protein QYE76_063096 [Lolium multiflorum]